MNPRSKGPLTGTQQSLPRKKVSPAFPQANGADFPPPPLPTSATKPMFPGALHVRRARSDFML